MANHRKEGAIRTAVTAYLAQAVESSPAEHPINKTKLAEVACTTRVTLGKWVTDDEIIEAIEKQARNGKLSPAERERRDVQDQVSRANARADAAEADNARLIALLNLVEANARRMGIDPEKLYLPIKKPLRQRSNAGKGGGRANRSYGK